VWVFVFKQLCHIVGGIGCSTWRNYGSLAFIRIKEVPMQNKPSGRAFLLWILLLFAGSGCAALIYEIVWLQLMELVLGSSSISLGVLLGTFMGGLCLGSVILPRIISPRFHPLRIFAFLELGIGIFGILVIFTMPAIAGFYASLSGHGVLARALIASICLMPPTLLMGATLPAASRFVESTPEGISWMGFFYAANIAGAVAGCLMAGFVLLRIFSMPTAAGAALSINILIAAIALLLARKRPHCDISPKKAPALRPESAGRRWIYLSIGLSGLCALGAEVIWTRLLSLLLGATVYSFSIILAVFLIGLGIGSSLGSILVRNCSKPRLLLGVFQMLLAGAIAWAAFMISKSLPYWPINPGMVTNDWGPWFIFQLDLLRAAWMVLPATILWGASFPLAIASVASQDQDPGRMVGGIYAANTIGSILGSLAFSLLIIPQLGTQWAQRSLIMVSAASAMIALIAAVMGKQPRENEDTSGWRFPFSWAASTILALILVVFLVDSVTRIPWPMIAWGRFSASYMAQAAPELLSEKQIPSGKGNPKQWYCTYAGEGMNVSVAVTQSTAGARFFHGAGKVQASSQPQDMRLQRMLGHLSALTCRKPDQIQDVLVIACGAGVTAGSFIPYPNIKRIVICDIEPLVPKIVAPMFGKENYHIVDGIEKENPHFVNGKKVTVIYDDGRHYIRTLPEDAKFDVITSDPIDPWVKGSAALNTIEYYEMCKRHLKPGGVMSLWMPLYESNLASAKSLIATFFQVFPNGILFSNDEQLDGYDAVLLGQAEPAPIEIDQLQQLLNRDDYLTVRESLSEVGFGRGIDPKLPDSRIAINLFATYAGQAVHLKDWSLNAQINRDRDLRLQYLAGMYFNSYQSTKILQSILAHYRFPDNLFKGSGESIGMLKQTLGELGRQQ
jgi:spermidine synthase